jgi:uncharacterized YigZ family protein
VYVIAGPGEHEIEIQRSRFLCHLTKVTSAAGATEVIARIRREHWSADHNCSAFRIGPDGEVQRSSDDGEPAGTAGVPMLEVLKRRELTDTLAVVTRYFGGTKLGAGGLVRAYGRAVSEAVDAIGVRRRVRFRTFDLAAGHAEAGRLENALRASAHRLADVRYGGEVTFTVQVPESGADDFHRWLAEQTGGKVTATEGPAIDLEIPE